MQKWFQRSLMILGVLYIVLLPLAILASNEESQIIDNLGIAVMLLSFVFMGVALVSGIGIALQWMRQRSTEKAKRGLIYEDAMLNRIMQRLSDEERSYLQGYLAAQPYEAVEGFDYTIDEKDKRDYE